MSHYKHQGGIHTYLMSGVIGLLQLGWKHGEIEIHPCGQRYTLINDGEITKLALKTRIK